MLTQELNIGGLNVQTFRAENSRRLIYILSYMPLDPVDVEPLVSRHDCNIAVISGIDWDNDMTPWSAPSVAENTPPFGGNADEFLKKLMQEILPEVEHCMGIENPERSLIGVSLSGLFATWAWVSDETPFINVASISGSFWFDGFVKWLEEQHIKRQEGLVYMSLGELEPKSKVPAFRTVGNRTQNVIACLKAAGDKVLFEWTPGDHFSPSIPRISRALSAMFPRA